jgi:hypothetical protein
MSLIVVDSTENNVVCLKQSHRVAAGLANVRQTMIGVNSPISRADIIKILHKSAPQVLSDWAQVPENGLCSDIKHFFNAICGELFSVLWCGRCT